jgi:hypothetical protein
MYEGKAAPLRVLQVAAADGYKLHQRALHVYTEAARQVALLQLCPHRRGTR